MDGWLAKARAFAEETAKKSQELASQTAKYSEQLAKDAAKRSRELAEKSRVLAEEAARKADIGYKALVKDFSTSTLSTSAARAAPTEEELLEYGVTAEFREFIKGLTIKTFRDFPLEQVEDPDNGNSNPTESAESADAERDEHRPQISKDLTAWQERHATLVLMVVPEISDFRYVLCPRRMTERNFWRIYFMVVRSHVAPYEAQAAEKAAKLKAQKEAAAAAEADKKLAAETEEKEKAQALSSSVQTLTTQDQRAGTQGSDPTVPAASAVQQKKTEVKGVENEHDLDAYLMGALGDEDGGDDDDEGDFDPEDFDQFVNNGALDSPSTPEAKKT